MIEDDPDLWTCRKRGAAQVTAPIQRSLPIPEKGPVRHVLARRPGSPDRPQLSGLLNALTQAGYDVDYREFGGGHVPIDLIEAAFLRFLG